MTVKELRRRNSVDIDSGNGSIIKEKNLLLPVGVWGSSFFFSFQKGKKWNGVQEGKQDVTKDVY